MRIPFLVGSILEKNSLLGAVFTWSTKTLEKRTKFIQAKQIECLCSQRKGRKQEERKELRDGERLGKLGSKGRENTMLEGQLKEINNDDQKLI